MGGGLERWAMEASRVDDLTVLGPIGSGGTGHVYEAVDATGAAVALKIFENFAISSALLERTTQRLEAGGWPDGVLPVILAEFGEVPAFRLTPLMADRGNSTGDGARKSLRPRSLQHRLDQYPGLDSWNFVRSLAKAIAGMHSRQVAHGNLKPGNIFFDDEGGVLLTDWAMGNMPGIAQFQFTDAVLYQAPEQLKEPRGYLDGAGYRWDVFAFGVIAYRVLTGRFPRCHQAFSHVAPQPGETHRDGFKADLHKIAGNLESHAEVAWPDEAQSALEHGFRKCIDACLALDPGERPASMIELVRAIDEVEREIRDSKDRESLAGQCQRAERATWRALFGLGAATGLALICAGMWYVSRNQVKFERLQRMEDGGRLKKVAEDAQAAKTAAEGKVLEVEKAMADEREASLARLEASRWIGDLLFSWAMEKGNRRLPPLDGREVRLNRLERYFEDFLTRTENLKSLTAERAKVRLQLAEIALAAGDPVVAARRLVEATEAWGSRPIDGELRLRFATNSLLLALLRQENGDPEAKAAFQSARQSLSKVPRAEVEGERLDQLSAILDFHESKLQAAAGDETKALEQLMRATQTLIRISQQRPDSAVLKSELANCYLSSAAILEAAGNLADAREVRVMAAGQMTTLLKMHPQDLRIRLDLAGCYSAMSEDALLSGNMADAETFSREAMQLLDGILSEQPNEVEAIVGKAAQLGMRAGLLRDRGRQADAMEDFDEGIRMLEALKTGQNGNSKVAYRLALLWWQKGRILGAGGARDGEIGLMTKARQVLDTLTGPPPADEPPPEQLRRSKAYLCGDLGHALQISDRKEEAIRAFSDAISEWQQLAQKRPNYEEYAEGLFWCKQRLEDLN